MDRRDLLQKIGLATAAGAFGGHARAEGAVPPKAEPVRKTGGVRLELHDLKRGLYALNPYSGELERLSGRRARVELDGDAHSTRGLWVAADEAAGTVTVLVPQERLPRGVLRFEPDDNPANPYGRKMEILRGRVEIYYRWKGQENYERLLGPVVLCEEAGALQEQLLEAELERAQGSALPAGLKGEALAQAVRSLPPLGPWAP